MTTSRPVGRPRSLADDLRARTPEALTRLIAARHDLIHPMPGDLAALAARSATTHSVNAALDTLDQFHLQVCEALAALPDPATMTQLHAGLKGVPGYDKKAVDAAVARLREIGLVWGHSVHLVRAAREAFGAYPCGLGGSFAHARGLVREYESDPSQVVTLVSGAPAGVAQIIADLLWTPHGTMPSATRRVDPAKARTPLDWMLAHDIIVATGEQTVVMPREVSLALREGRLLRDMSTEPAELRTTTLDMGRVDEVGAHNALESVRLVETLLEDWSYSPPSALRSGGLAARDLSAAATSLRCDEATAALVIESAFAANLIAVDDAGRWVPTTAYDRWLAAADAQRWSGLAAAWRAMPRSSHTLDDDRPLSTAAERPWLAPLRQTVIAALRDHAPGTATDAPHLTAYLDWQRPRRSSQVRDNALIALLREAETLGITGAGALTTFGGALFAEGERAAATALAPHIPAPVDHIIVQADLTALAPGRLLPVPARMMAVIADVESAGVATTYRFTEAGIRRALDQGMSAREVLTFLTDLSKTPLPQPLTYLVEDVARNHGTLRVGVASVYLRCDDEDLLHSVLVDRRLTALRLRTLAPGIVVSPAHADTVLERLREAGYLPVAENAEGAVLIHRPDAHRTGSRTNAQQNATALAPSQRLVEAAVQALLAADNPAPEQDGGPGPRGASSQTVALVREAVDTGQTLWIGYADKSGVSREFTVEPLALTAGFLTAFDVSTSEVRTYTVSRITGAEYAAVRQEGTAS